MAQKFRWSPAHLCKIEASFEEVQVLAELRFTGACTFSGRGLRSVVVTRLQIFSNPLSNDLRRLRPKK